MCPDRKMDTLETKARAELGRTDGGASAPGTERGGGEGGVSWGELGELGWALVGGR